MTAATYDQSQDGVRNYFSDVSKAARAFASALFAAQERQYIAQEVAAKPALSERARAKSRSKLFSLANHYQDLQPNLAAELRNLATRD